MSRGRVEARVNPTVYSLTGAFTHRFNSDIFRVTRVNGVFWVVNLIKRKEEGKDTIDVCNSQLKPSFSNISFPLRMPWAIGDHGLRSPQAPFLQVFCSGRLKWILPSIS